MEILKYFYEISGSSFIIGIAFLFAFYWYSTLNHSYWKKIGIPYAKPYPLVGSIEFKKMNFEELSVKRYKELGRIYGFYESSKPLIAIAEPELLRKILVKDFQYFSNRRVFDLGDPVLNKGLSFLRGEDWKRVRTIMTPTFTTGKIKRLVSIFEDSSKIFIENLKASSTQHTSTDVFKYYGAFAMDVIATAAFSTKLDSHNDPENEFVKIAKKAFSFKLGIRAVLVAIMPNVMRLLGYNIFDIKSMSFFEGVTRQIIERRRETGETRNDFLQLLLDTAKEVSEEENLETKNDDVLSNYKCDSISNSFSKSISNKYLSMDEIISQCIFLFVGGYHTTAVTLGLATYYLALNETIQDKVFQEIKDVLYETEGELKYESIQKMKYLDNVISETLRMKAPVIGIERTAEVDYKLGETGIIIPKGMIVHVPVYAMQQDPTFFPEPEKFNPDRFSPEQSEELITYSFLPFGAGPRNCIGMRFALVQMKVCLIYALSTFQFKTSSETKIPLEFGMGAGLIQPTTIDLQLERRTDNPLRQ